MALSEQDMNNDLLMTIEIFLIIDAPLLFFYLKGKWPLRVIIPCLVSLPVFWYLTYAPVHELSHIAGTYAAGGSVSYYKLIPQFWLGEFGRAWITSQGMTRPWQQLLSTSAPYLIDVASLGIGFFILRKPNFRNPFLLGLLFTLLCLRPAFDFVCESVSFITGIKGDLFTMGTLLGIIPVWIFILACLSLSLAIIVSILKRCIKDPEHLPIHSAT